MLNSIRICSHHADEYPAPLLMTMAFPGCEWWCPYCGQKFEFLGAGVDVKRTPDMVARAAKYRNAYGQYLRGVGFLSCSATEINGKFVRKADVPRGFAEEMACLRETWKQGVKAEDLPEVPHAS